MAFYTKFEYVCDCCNKKIEKDHREEGLLTKIYVPVIETLPSDCYQNKEQITIDSIECCSECIEKMKKYFLKEYYFQYEIDDQYNNKIVRKYEN